jgi:hypothetical protein
MRLQMSQGKMQTLSFQFKVNTDDEEAPLEKSYWQPSSRFQPLIFKPIKVSISKANSNWKDIDAETIEILPNGFITDATISYTIAHKSPLIQCVAVSSFLKSLSQKV